VQQSVVCWRHYLSIPLSQTCGNQEWSCWFLEKTTNLEGDGGGGGAGAEDVDIGGACLG
jgi:hypothetical protein